MKKLMAYAALFFASCAVLAAQEAADSSAEEKAALAAIKDLYEKAQYTECLAVIQAARADREAGKLVFSGTQVADLNVYEAFVVYAFREEGYQEKIRVLLFAAIEADLNYDFQNYAAVPPFILDRFISLKKEYHARFSKSARRHSIGLYGVINYLPATVAIAEYIKPGIHYTVNLSDYVSLLFDFEVPLSLPLFNVIQFRTGAIWFPSFKIETISMGLGLFYSLRIEEFINFTNMVSFEGYGEIVLRSGLGFGASVELLRFEFLIGPGTLQTIGFVDIFSTPQLRFTFASLRIYAFFTF